MSGLRIKGFVLDGLDRIPTLVVISGNCPGTTLDSLHFQGFQQCAVIFDRAAGTSDEPVSLTNSRIAPATTTPSALRFEEAYHVRVSDNRLEGPFQAAIALNGPTTNLEFTRNRICNATDGIVYRKATPANPLSITLASNTFCEIEKVALRFETVAAAGRQPGDADEQPVRAHRHAGEHRRFQHGAANTPAQWIWFDEQRPLRRDGAGTALFPQEIHSSTARRRRTPS